MPCVHLFVAGCRDHFSLELGDSVMLTELPEGLKDEVLYSVSPRNNLNKAFIPLLAFLDLRFMNILYLKINSSQRREVLCFELK